MKKVFLVTATVFFVSLLLSCQNFLSGQNTKQELIDAINYNNAPSCTLLFKADDGTGTFLTGTEKICKAGYSIDVQFSVNSQAYLYAGMQAVSRANPTVSRKDFIEFTELSTPEEIKDGTIKTKIKLLKKSDDIMIRPVCLMRPSITHCTEFTKDGYNANTPIEITFNMPMESEQEKSSKFIFGKEYISIYHGNKELADYFSAPKFNSQKTELTITPKPQEFEEYIKSQNSAFIDITVSFGNEIFIQKDDKILYLTQNEYSNFTVRYIPKIEQEKPKEFSFFASRKKITLENAKEFSDTDKFILKTLDNISEDEEFIQNRTSGIIYIYGQYFDNDSGVKSIQITENLTNLSDGSSPSLPQEFTKNYTSKNCTFTEDGEGNTYFIIQHELSCDDGAILITAKVFDSCNNYYEPKPFCVFKKSYINTDAFELYNAYNYFGNFWNTEDFDSDYYYNNIRSIKLVEYNSSKYLRRFYTYYEIPQDNFTIYGEYQDQNGNTKILNFTRESHNTLNASLELEKLSGRELTIHFKDDTGLTAQKEFVFPSTEDVNYAIDINDFGDGIINFLEKGDKHIDKILAVWEEDEKTKIHTYESSPIVILAGYKYRFIIKIGNFYTELSEQEVSIQTQSCDIPEVQLKKGSSYTITKVDDESSQKKINIKFELDEDTWKDQKYDSIYAEINYWFSDKKYVVVPNGSTSLSFEIPTDNAYSNPTRTTIYGIKNGIRTKGTKLEDIPVLTQPEYDNIEPSFEYPKQNTYEELFVKYVDNESGIEKVRVTLNNAKEIEITDENAYIPLFDFVKEDEDKFETAKKVEFNCKIYDKAQNCAEGIISCYIYEHSPFIKQTHENGKWTFSTGNVFNNSFEAKQVNYSLEFDFNIEELQEDGSWDNQDTIYKKSCTLQSDFEDGSEVLTAQNIFLPQNTFVKIITKWNDWKNWASHPVYLYTGDQGSGNNIMFKNGTSTSSVAISSDAPVFVHTLVTSKPYQTCKDWKWNNWEHYHKHIGNACMDFSTSTNAQRYNIPVDQIEKDECYVVIAHFANGETIMSEVMQK